MPETDDTYGGVLLYCFLKLFKATLTVGAKYKPLKSRTEKPTDIGFSRQERS